jgi:hypothetical protein
MLGTYKSRPAGRQGVGTTGMRRGSSKQGGPSRKRRGHGGITDLKFQIHPSRDPRLIRGSPRFGGAAVRREVSRLPLHGAGLLPAASALIGAICGSASAKSAQSADLRDGSLLQEAAHAPHCARESARSAGPFAGLRTKTARSTPFSGRIPGQTSPTPGTSRTSQADACHDAGSPNLLAFLAFSCGQEYLPPLPRSHGWPDGLGRSGHDLNPCHRPASAGAAMVNRRWNDWLGIFT